MQSTATGAHRESQYSQAMSEPAPTVAENTPVASLKDEVRAEKEVAQPVPESTPAAIASDPYLVRLEGAEDPKSTPLFKKWLTICIICSAATCVTCASSVVRYGRFVYPEASHKV